MEQMPKAVALCDILLFRILSIISDCCSHHSALLIIGVGL